MPSKAPEPCRAIDTSKGWGVAAHHLPNTKTAPPRRALNNAQGTVPPHGAPLEPSHASLPTSAVRRTV